MKFEGQHLTSKVTAPDEIPTPVRNCDAGDSNSADLKLYRSHSCTEWLDALEETRTMENVRS